MEQHPQQPDGSAFPSGRLQLRPYQLDVINQCRQKLAAGVSRICLVAPTGSGKTVIAAEIIRSAVAKGKRVLVLAHTREIIKQTSLKLNAAGIAHGIIMATDTVRPYEPVQVASVQTYWSRVMRTKRMDPPPADLVIVDECHHIRARTWFKIIDSYSKQQFVEFGLHPRMVAPALRELEALGIIRIEHGRGGNAEHRQPNRFLLNYLCGAVDADEQITNAWRLFKTKDEAVEVRRTARKAKDPQKVAYGRRTAGKRNNFLGHKVCPKPGSQSAPEIQKFSGAQSVPTGPGAQSVPTVDISGGGGDVAPRD